MFGASFCDAPWLSLKSVTTCVFGIRLSALERARLFDSYTDIPPESLLEPILFRESARQNRERFRSTFW